VNSCIVQHCVHCGVTFDVTFRPERKMPETCFTPDYDEQKFCKCCGHKDYCHTRVRLGCAIRTLVQIEDGDGCDSPHVLIARVGDVLQITQVYDGTDGHRRKNTVSARHFNYAPTLSEGHHGFFLAEHEYELADCLCDGVKRNRRKPCWVTPIPIPSHTQGWETSKAKCCVCGHKVSCHTHTDKTERRGVSHPAHRMCD
jgi:hypothetical protein